VNEGLITVIDVEIVKYRHRDGEPGDD